jgi:hypothetical protein
MVQIVAATQMVRMADFMSFRWKLSNNVGKGAVMNKGPNRKMREGGGLACEPLLQSLKAQFSPQSI